MKIAIITDTHFGAKGDSQIFLEHTFKFFEDVFFPTIKERGITNVLHLGDLMDRRKYVNFHTLHQMRTRLDEEEFFENARWRRVKRYSSKLVRSLLQ